MACEPWRKPRKNEQGFAPANIIATVLLGFLVFGQRFSLAARQLIGLGEPLWCWGWIWAIDVKKWNSKKVAMSKRKILQNYVWGSMPPITVGLCWSLFPTAFQVPFIHVLREWASLEMSWAEYVLHKISNIQVPCRASTKSPRSSLLAFVPSPLAFSLHPWG